MKLKLTHSVSFVYVIACLGSRSSVQKWSLRLMEVRLLTYGSPFTDLWKSVY